MPQALIIGANRGLGASLTKLYAAEKWDIYGTTRSEHRPHGFSRKVQWITGIDLMQPDVGTTLTERLGQASPFDVVFITAGIFTTESFEDGPNWQDEIRMYTTSSIAPVFIVRELVNAGLLTKGSKVLLVSSEAGSIALRISAEGNYAHHASKAALNMVGRLLSFDLKEKEIVVTMVHPGFMRTEMTAGVGFDKYWDEFHAVTPDEAARSLVLFADGLDMSKSGEFWAPRGAKDIGTAKEVLGKDLPTPLQLPW